MVMTNIKYPSLTMMTVMIMHAHIATLSGCDNDDDDDDDDEGDDVDQQHHLSACS